MAVAMVGAASQRVSRPVPSSVRQLRARRIQPITQRRPPIAHTRIIRTVGFERRLQRDGN